ncbi:NAD(P)/FAD-dependent oxidoreductase, partial [Aestuariivirga sp.]|uniref:NAD(P)/FAD-dependent oxidoreductase n=1 Tax=Aestuariivirga sp. TaxID=2650926 RepID=UPI003919447D
MTGHFEVAVIGGGVVGLAILRRMAMAGLGCILLERGADILSGASKGNSALLHTGFDAPPGSLELACMQAGHDEFLAIRARLNLPLLETGALVVAWSEAELGKLEEIAARARLNGVTDVALIDAAGVRRREPQLSAAALGAVAVPREHVIDPWSTPLAYAHQALAHGASIRRNAEVRGGRFAQGRWRLDTAVGEVSARIVINAAGNFGDIVEEIARPSPFSIRPRRGQFVVFDKPAAALVNAIVLPVPSERTKGVVLFRTIFGNLAIGPTAEDVEEREIAACDGETLSRLRSHAPTIPPAPTNVGVNKTSPGLRPAS